ncbi:MAG: DUF397 domain-containing protein [Pseudonocardiaceae bacterium]
MTTTTREPGAPAAGGWFTSSRSNPLSECVEVNLDHPDGLVRIRDSKDCGAGPTISVTGEQWATFLDEFAGIAPAGRNGAVPLARSDCPDRVAPSSASAPPPQHPVRVPPQ